MQTDIWTITHANCRNAEAVYGVGVPPIRTCKKLNLLFGGQSLDELGHGGL